MKKKLNFELRLVMKKMENENWIFPFFLFLLLNGVEEGDKMTQIAERLKAKKMDDDKKVFFLNLKINI